MSEFGRVICPRCGEKLVVKKSFSGAKKCSCDHSFEVGEDDIKYDTFLNNILFQFICVLIIITFVIKIFSSSFSETKKDQPEAPRQETVNAPTVDPNPPTTLEEKLARISKNAAIRKEQEALREIEEEKKKIEDEKRKKEEQARQRSKQQSKDSAFWATIDQVHLNACGILARTSGNLNREVGLIVDRLTKAMRNKDKYAAEQAVNDLVRLGNRYGF